MWIDKGNYWLSVHEQRSDEWMRIRRRLITASNFGSAAGISPYTSIEKFAREFHSPEAAAQISRLPCVQHGIEWEPVAREWYEKKYKVTVEELGLAVPKWDMTLGGSADGSVGPDGMIEIKCPMRMYRSLIDYVDAKRRDWVPPEDYIDHIPLTHYAQMQGCMAILGKKWCDYIVFCKPTEGRVFTQRIKFDPIYWKELYGKLKSFVSKYGTELGLGIEISAEGSIQACS